MPRDYWKDRQAKALTTLSSKSSKEIDAQLKKYYRRTMETTIKDFEATYDKLLASMDDGRAPTTADLYKLDKYWQMQAQLKDQLQALGDEQAAVLSKEFEANYINVYESLAKKDGGAFSRISTETAQQMINNVWTADGKSWSSRIWENTADLAETLNEKLIECVVGGKKTSELKKALMERFGVSFNRADALARTELAHIQTQAAKKRYEETGVERVQIWADPDERTCPICGELHKKIYPVGASVPIPAHPRCRCCIIPVVDVPEEQPTQQPQPKEQPKAQPKEQPLATAAKQKDSKPIQTEKTHTEQHAISAMATAHDEKRKHFGLNSVEGKDLAENGGIVADYGALALDVADELNATLDKLNDDYYGGFIRIEAKETTEKAIMITDTNNVTMDRELVININKFGKNGEANARITSDNDFLAKVKAGKENEYYITHEYGHSLLNTAKFADTAKELGVPVEKLGEAQRKAKSLYKAYTDELTGLSEEIKALEKKGEKFFQDDDFISAIETGKKIKELQNNYDEMFISKYSTTSPDEFIAEAFAQHRVGATKKKYAEKLMNEVINPLFKKKN